VGVYGDERASAAMSEALASVMKVEITGEIDEVNFNFFRRPRAQWE